SDLVFKFCKVAVDDLAQAGIGVGGEAEARKAGVGQVDGVAGGQDFTRRIDGRIKIGPRHSGHCRIAPQVAAECQVAQVEHVRVLAQLGNAELKMDVRQIDIADVVDRNPVAADRAGGEHLIAAEPDADL